MFLVYGYIFYCKNNDFALWDKNFMLDEFFLSF